MEQPKSSPSPSQPSPPPYAYYLEDEIDLRELVQTLWRHRWRLILPSVALALVALVVSLLQPKQYRATAYVRIHTPVKSALVTQPTSKEVLTIAESSQVLAALADDPKVQALYQDVDNFSSRFLKGRVQAKKELETYFALIYTDTEPQRAAAMANRWAEVLISTLNEIYGIDAALEQIEAQMEIARREYERAQEEYLARLQEDEGPLLMVRWQQAHDTLDCIRSRIDETPRLQQMLRNASRKVTNQPQDTTLPLSLVLDLLNLESRVFNFGLCSSAPTAPGFFLPAYEMTTQEALRLLEEMEVTLKEQRQDLQEEEKRLSEEIRQLQKEIELAEAQMREVQSERERAWDVYQDLRQQRLHLFSLRETGWQVASLVVEASPPHAPISPRPVVNTAVGFVVGLMVGFLWIFVPKLWE